MIADLIEYNKHRSEIRLITKNVMSVYSIKQIYTDNLIHKLKHADYLVDNKIRKSSDIISYNDKKYNMYENVYRYIISDTNYSLSRFAEYLNYFNLNHILWLHFYQIPSDDLHLVEILMTLSSNKPIIILDYIDKLSYKNKLYSLLFHIGLLDKLIIVPYTDIPDAISNVRLMQNRMMIIKHYQDFQMNLLNKNFQQDAIIIEQNDHQFTYQN